MSSGRTVLKNFGALALSGLAITLIQLAEIVYLARVLGPENFGILKFGMALLSYFSLIISLGFCVYGTREVARNPANTSLLVGNILAMRVLLAVIGITCYAVVVLLIKKTVPVKIVLAILGFNLVGTAFSLEFVYHGVQRMSVPAVLKVAASVIGFAGIVMFIRQPEDIILAALVWIIAGFLPILGLIGKYTYDFSLPRFQWKIEQWKPILKASLPMAASSIMISIYYNADMVMLGFMRYEHELGWYAAAYQIHGFVIGPAAILSAVFMPPLSKTIHNSFSMRKEAENYAQAILLFGIPLAFMGVAFSSDILVIIFGKEFANANIALIILMWNSLFVYINVMIGTPLIAWNFQKKRMYAVSAGAIANLVLNMILIPRYGIEGAAVATLCSEIVVLFGVAWFYFQALKWFPIGLLIKISICAAIAISVVRLFHNVSWIPQSQVFKLLFNVSSMCVLYILLAVLMRLIPIRKVLKWMGIGKTHK